MYLSLINFLNCLLQHSECLILALKVIQDLLSVVTTCNPLNPLNQALLVMAN